MVVIATGGVPDLEWLDGHQHCLSTWDILAGTSAPNGDVLIYDGTGLQPAVSCGDHLAAQGKRVSLATPDDRLGFDLPYVDAMVYRKRFHEQNITLLFDHRLLSVSVDGNKLDAVFANVFTGAITTRSAEHIVVEHGTVPVDDLYHELRRSSSNNEVTDIEALLAVRPQPQGDGTGFELYRIGDAVASRNIHAAIYDALRLCVTF